MPVLHTTDPITYHYSDRRRRHRGVDRDIDLRSLTAAINSPATQERIRGGDMLGYFGHWPRRVFGMEPGEGGIVGGAVVSLEPAIRTVALSIDEAGNITHQQAFLDTVDGGKALRTIVKAEAGGFSSAISPDGAGTPAKIRQFHGFDCVYEPNYSANRVVPVLLDSVGGADGQALLDDVTELAARCDARMLGAMDALQVEFQRMREALEFQCRQNDLLIARAAAGGRAVGMLDSAGTMVVPGRRDITTLARLQSYRNEPLAPLSPAPDQVRSGPPSAAESALEMMRMGR